MALMPPDGYPVASYADLRRAMERAQYDPKAAVAVRNFLMESAYYRSLVASGQMNHNQYFIALENLRQLQKDAAASGYQFYFETEDGTGHKVVHHPPAMIEAAPREIEKKPFEPEGVHFTSHQRVGDEIKDSYLEHIREMFAGGYIDSGEHDARLAAMMLAHTKEEMEFLIQDLPKITEKEDVIEAPLAETGSGKLTIDPLAGLMLTFVSCLGTITVIANNAPNFGSITTVVLMMMIAAASCLFTLRGITFKHKK